MNGYTLYATLTDSRAPDGNKLKVSREDDEYVKIELMDNKDKILGDVIVSTSNLTNAIQETTQLKDEKKEEHNVE